MKNAHSDFSKEIDKAQKYFETTHLSLGQIGLQVGVHKKTILRWSQRYGWNRLPDFVASKGGGSDVRHAVRKEVVTPAGEVVKEPLNSGYEWKIRKLEAEKKDLRADNTKLIEELGKLQEDYDFALGLKAFTPVTIPHIDLKTIQGKSQGCVILQYSDWHIEERVDLEVTDSKNKYTPDIAKRRAKKLVENTLKLIDKERAHVAINQLFVCLGGDFINNYLHEHDAQMNYLPPFEAALVAKGMLKECLLTLAKFAKVKKITVMCIRGNHGRLTKRMQSSNDYGLNHEAMIYGTLADELKSNKIFEFHIPQSEFGYVKIGDKMIRCFHGHQVKYMGGMGGLTIPLNKYLLRLDQNEKADWNLIHHFHQLSMPTANCSLNGSLVGFNSYAASLGMKYEPPLQSFQLLDSKRGFTVRTPIFAE